MANSDLDSFGILGNSLNDMQINYNNNNIVACSFKLKNLYTKEIATLANVASFLYSFIPLREVLSHGQGHAGAEACHRNAKYEEEIHPGWDAGPS